MTGWWMDARGRRDRERHRLRRRAKGEDDRDAADGGAVQRRRRWRGRARLGRRVPQSLGGGRRRRRRARDRDRAVGVDRLDLVRRLDGRVREAAGARLGPADHVSGSAGRERGALRRAVGLGAWAMADVKVWVLVCDGRRCTLFGVLFVLPIGGADMPVVISLLNAFTGLAASATGFVLHSNILIVSGALVGASGTLLTMLMGRAMNRSIANVLFGAFGKVVAGPAGARPRRCGRSVGARDERGRRGGHARVREAGRRRSRIRARGGASAARGSAARGPARVEGRRREVRNPSRRGPDAGPHERAARRGERPVRPAQGDGRDQPGLPADRRRARDRRQRRDEPRRAEQPEQPDLRHADPQR